jgi:hypothetical protein
MRMIYCNIRFPFTQAKISKLSAKINSRLFLKLFSIEEEMVSDLQKRLSSGELKPTFSDLLPVSVALDNTSRQAMRAREDVEQVNPERPMITQQNYEDTLAAARKRMAELKAVASRPTASDWP